MADRTPDPDPDSAALARLAPQLYRALWDATADARLSALTAGDSAEDLVAVLAYARPWVRDAAELLRKIPKKSS